MINILEIHQGEDLTITFNEKDFEGNDVILDEYTNVVLYAWVVGESVLKFSKDAREGYGLIQSISDKEYAVKITAEQTKLLKPGLLHVEIFVCDPSERSIFAGELCKIILSKIKEEVA